MKHKRRQLRPAAEETDGILRCTGNSGHYHLFFCLHRCEVLHPVGWIRRLRRIRHPTSEPVA
ncbi:hypothetical protein ACN63_06555 [Escherichia coli]|nr:hypothetical protein ACN63_06555 [Escherichia coli]